jgi:bifunctional DNase/RNase
LKTSAYQEKGSIDSLIAWPVSYTVLHLEKLGFLLLFIRRTPVKKSYLGVAFALILVFPLRLAAQEATVEMQVKRIVLDPLSSSPVVILESLQDRKLLPIWIGNAEATSIAMHLERVASPRPNTHDLIRNILQGLGASLHRIVITDLRNNTYYATLTLKLKHQELQIDSRPSDAIALALRMKAAIFVTAEVLAKARPIPAPSMQKDMLRESLGIHLQELTPEIAGLLEIQGTQGVLVADVELGGPAMNAGLQRGDVVVKVNEKVIHKLAQVEAAVKSSKRPSRLRLEVLRKGKPLMIEVDLARGSP